MTGKEIVRLINELVKIYLQCFEFNNPGAAIKVRKHIEYWEKRLNKET